MEFMRKALPAPPSGSLGGTPSRRKGRGHRSRAGASVTRSLHMGLYLPILRGGGFGPSRAGEAFDVEPTSVLGLQNTVALEAAIDAPLLWAQRRSGEGIPGGGPRIRPRQRAAVTHSWRHSFVLLEPPV